MRIRVSVRSIVLLVAFASPALLMAQFQPPNPDELKMTSDPKAPGAAAVYLEVNEVDNDPMHYEKYYARIKVLTEKGKELATQELHYRKGNFKINDIKGRTIHADGTIVPLNVKPEDLLVSKVGERQVQKKVFTLPSVEVGSILEYTYQLDYDENLQVPPSWDVQQEIPVAKAHYEFTPFQAFLPGARGQTSSYMEDENGDVINTLMAWPRVPVGAKLAQSPASGIYSLDVTDVAAIPDEAWMPPLRSLLYSVEFYYMSASSMQEFWITAGKRWTKRVDHFAEPTNVIKAAAAGIVLPGDSSTDKAKKLYAAVEALDNTDYSRAKTDSERKELKIRVAKSAEDTWKQKSGDSEDIAMLYLALLRAEGLTAYPAKVVDREERIFDASYMNVNQLDDTLVVLNADGKQTLLDPGEKMCPFGTVNWRHSGVRGLGESPQGLSITTTPQQSYMENKTNRTGHISLDEHGAVSGDINIIMTGQEALSWRQFALRNDVDEVKKQYDKDLESIVPDGVEAHVDHFLSMDDPSTNLMAVVKVSGNMGTATAKRILLPGMFFETRGSAPFVNEEKRLEPVDMHYGSITTDQITYTLPAGLTVEGAPADASIDWAAHSKYVVKSVTTPGQIIVARSIARAFADAKPEEYQDLRGFYTKVAASDQSEIVLTTAPATAKDSSVVDLK